MKPFPDYSNYDGIGLAELVRNGDTTASELVETAIQHIEALNPKLNAVVYEAFDRARERAMEPLADGPFAGVPFLLKDFIVFCKDMPLTNGSRFLKDFVPDHDSEIVARQRRAGLIFCGRTNSPEYGMAFVTEPKLWGPARNPWNTEHTPGGSSGGAAACVAAGIVPVAHANDVGGSIRVPSSCCGIFGLKPTRARTPHGPDASDPYRGFPVEHCVSRTVRDSAALLDATAGPDVGAPYYPPPPERSFLESSRTPPDRLRIAFTAQPPIPVTVDQACVDAVDHAAHLCAELGHDVEQAHPEFKGMQFFRDFLAVMAVNMATDFELHSKLVGRRPGASDHETLTRLMAQLGRAMHADRYELAAFRLHHTARRIAHFFEQYDVLLTPVTAFPAPKIGALEPPRLIASIQSAVASVGMGRLLGRKGVLDTVIRDAMAFTPFTPVQNVTGQPAMSVPLHWTKEGLPVGVQFVGRYADESTLFQLGGQLEEAHPWEEERPSFNVDTITARGMEAGAVGERGKS